MSRFQQGWFRVLLVTLLAGALDLPNPSRADDIFNTFGPGLTHSGTSRVIFDSTDTANGADFYTYGILALGFRAPAYAARLDRVTVPFLMDNPSANISPVAVSIFTGEDFYDNGPPLGIVPNFLGQRYADLTQRTILLGGAFPTHRVQLHIRLASYVGARYLLLAGS